MSTIIPAAAYWTAVLAEATDVDRADAIAALLAKIAFLDSGGSTIRTISTAAWTRGALDGSNYPLTPGAVTDAASGSGTPVTAVFLNSSDAEIFRAPAGVLTGTVRLPDDITAATEIDAGTLKFLYPTEAQAATGKRWYPGHYLFVCDDVAHTGIKESRRNLVKDDANWAGYLCMYWWADLEPTQNGYDFSMIEADLAKCAADGKRMIIRLMERSYHGTSRPEPLPAYIASASGRWTYENIIYAKLWEPAINERLCLLIEALFAAFEDDEYFQGIMMEESTMSGVTSQAGYTHAKMAAWWEKMGQRGGSAASHALFFGNFNYGYSSSETNPTRAQIMQQLATVDRIGLGASDCRMPGDRNAPNGVFGYSFPWWNYAGIAPLIAGIEYNTYTTDASRPTRSAKDYIDYAVDQVKLNFMTWDARTSTSGVDFNIYDAIEEIDLQNGRIVSTRPTNAPAE